MELRALHEEDLAQLDEDGFSIVDGTLGRDAIRALQAGVSRLLREHPSQPVHGIRNLASRVPEVAELARHQRILNLVAPVIGDDPFLVRSIFFDKVPGANWKVAWHQDVTIAVAERVQTPGFGPWSIKEGIVSVQPPASILERMLTVRVHLDRCHAENGPLRVIPGSHRHGIVDADRIVDSMSGSEPVACVVDEGGALLMRPLILHASSPATAPHHRRVVHLDFAAAPLPSGLEWDLSA